ncbi:putative MYND-type zinc finger protein samB [Seiridium cardinale]|uniref:ribonuclease H n=1 Tax=Seiridium cardinale TaxID=138064 RepID=A0ABR2XLT8_9PEZI
MEYGTISWGLAPQRCAVCAKATGLLRCGSCKVVSYCGSTHQSTHRSEHKAVCETIKKSREALQREETALRARPADIFHPADVFNTRVGHFWGILGTRDYMRARHTAADALLKADTMSAVECALDHFTGMLRLCRSDNLGVRDAIPALLLRLGREQECYDFLKWWATIDKDDSYDWSDVTQPYLDIHGANAFEGIDVLSSHLSLSHLVSLTLLKLRLWLGLSPFEVEDCDWEFSGTSSSRFHRPTGMLVRTKVQSSDAVDVSITVEALEHQYRTLCRMVHDANPHFWPALIDEEDESSSLPPYYSPGSEEEASIVLHQCKRAWEESEDAILMITSDTSKFTPVYQGSAVISSKPTKMVEATEKRRGSGKAFPTSDRGKALVYVDGACPSNGREGPRAGWAVVYGLPNLDEEGSSGTLSRRLESKGPFGGKRLATSNRAELRAAIAALRLCDWRSDGFNSVVIATDSSYVVDGATSWSRGWVRKGWKTSKGDNVKNKDLWELLLGEVEKWKDRGLGVELWKIPRELNKIADKAAKKAANEETVEMGFRDLETESRPRILVLCLEDEAMFDVVFPNLISSLMSRARLERATTRETAIKILHQEPPPSVIFVADAALTHQMKIWDRVIDHLRGGATVVVRGCFSGIANRGEFDRFFARLGLPWERGSYGRTTVKLRTGVTDGHLTKQLPSAYSQEGLFVRNVESSAAWYTTEDYSGQAAVVFAKVGNGRLGYIGDVNGEESSHKVVLAMCGLSI